MSWFTRPQPMEKTLGGERGSWHRAEAGLCDGFGEVAHEAERKAGTHPWLEKYLEVRQQEASPLRTSNYLVLISPWPCVETGPDAASGGTRPHGRHAKLKYRNRS